MSRPSSVSARASPKTSTTSRRESHARSLLSQSAHGELENTSQGCRATRTHLRNLARIDALDGRDRLGRQPHHDTLDSLASYLGTSPRNTSRLSAGAAAWRCHSTCRTDTSPRRRAITSFSPSRKRCTTSSSILAPRRSSSSSILQTSGFDLVVRDNGKGFYPAACPGTPRSGNGLKNMRQRLEKLGGHYEIHSAQARERKLRSPSPHRWRTVNPTESRLCHQLT